jgi:hypothetical protein
MVKGTNNLGPTKIEQLVHNNVKFTSPVDISNVLNDYFSMIGSKLNHSLNSDKVDYGELNYHSDGFNFTQVDCSIVAKTLSSLKNNKNGGVNQIPAFIYKILEPLILAPLTHIINLSIAQNVFPNCWKEALIIPLFKGGDPSLPSNYRPISLLPILSKVFEKILSVQMRNYLEERMLLGARQFGFRVGCSTDQLIFQLTNLFKIKMTNKASKFISIAALAIKKAFDSVNHAIVMLVSSYLRAAFERVPSF